MHSSFGPLFVLFYSFASVDRIFYRLVTIYWWYGHNSFLLIDFCVVPRCRSQLIVQRRVGEEGKTERENSLEFSTDSFMCERSIPCLPSLQFTCHLLHFLDELLSPVFPGLCWLGLGKQAPFYLWAWREHPVFPLLMTMSAVHSTFIKSPWSCLVGWAICFLSLPDWDIYKRCERAGRWDRLRKHLSSHCRNDFHDQFWAWGVTWVCASCTDQHKSRPASVFPDGQPFKQ